MAITQLATRVILDGLSRLGIDGAEIARRVELPTRAPHVDERALAAVWGEARRQARRSSVPLEVGLQTPEASFGLIYYLASSAATVGAGLTLVQRCLPLAMPWLRLSLEERRDEVAIALSAQPWLPPSHETQLVGLGILLRRLERVSTRPVRPLRVDLPLGAPADGAAWSALVEGTPLRFGAGSARLVLRRRDWELPLLRADPRLRELLEEELALGERPHDALIVAVRTLVRGRLDRPPTLAEAAPALGLSPRSLQRRLRESGTTFEEERDGLRREIAEALLAQAHVSLGQVAQRVGFAEPASFTRAFVRWTGSTPSHARRRLVARATAH
jgi:AraC-like DNA-binding protein